MNASEPRHRSSDLTAKTFLDRLAKTGLSMEEYAWLTGRTLGVIMSYASGKRDGRIPETDKLALEYAGRYPEEMQDRARRIKAVFGPGLPMTRMSELDGPTFGNGLDDVGWSMRDFARLTGYSRNSIQNLAAGRTDRISLIIAVIWEYVRRHPLELQARPIVQPPLRQTRAQSDARWRTYIPQPEAH